MSKVFIETGTFLGDTIAREVATNKWSHLHTVDIDKRLFRAAAKRFRDEPRITCHHGSSPDVLSLIIDPTQVTHFYLDAHRTGTNEQARQLTGRDYTRHDKSRGECPLLDELAVILAFDWTTLPRIVIDDAQNFVPGKGFWRTGPSQEYDAAQWPTMEQIAAQLPNYSLDIVNDHRKRNTAIVATVL